MHKEDYRIMDSMPESMLVVNDSKPSLKRALPDFAFPEPGVNKEAEESTHIATILFRTLHWTPSQFREEILKLEKELAELRGL